MSERGRRCGAGASTAELEEQREEEEEVEEVEEEQQQQQQQQKACRWLLLTTANLYTSAIERTIAPCTRGSWIACWSPDDGSVLQQKVLSLKGVDFRDRVPPSLDAVALAYRDKVREGSWTVGLFDMWTPKAKFVKHAVHVPCWTSFRWRPWLWRGWCLGKTWNQCLWTGWRQMRWSRAAYAGALGREYVMPVYEVGRHGYQSDVRALCGLGCAMACVFSCGIGQVLSLCGNVCTNFGAVYTCNARRKVRQKYGLPPAIPCFPLGFDDCLVDFFCFYCASHQLMRELAVRGVDGPGLHVLDVVPEAYAHLGDEGIAAAVANRRRIVEVYAGRALPFFQAKEQREKRLGDRNRSLRRLMTDRLDEAFLASAVGATESLANVVLLSGDRREDAVNCREFGWNCPGLTAPAQMSMRRTSSDVVSGWSECSKRDVLSVLFQGAAGVEEVSEEGRKKKGWSVAY